jgi:hypothetical protein
MVARKRYTRKPKRRSTRARNAIKWQKKVGGASRTYIFIISYRARGNQKERREQLQAGMASIRQCFRKNKKLYKIVVTEQDNDHPFNMGLLKNIGFLEAEKVCKTPRMYLHFNADYSIDTSLPFPTELEQFDGNGVLNIYSVGVFIGGCCAFSPETFVKINGYMNTMFGWGGDDRVITGRVEAMGLPNIRNTVTNNGWIKVEDVSTRNMSHNIPNAEQSSKNDGKDGLSTCKYVINGPGEFDDPANNIHHLLADFEFTE